MNQQTIQKWGPRRNELAGSGVAPTTWGNDLAAGYGQK